MIAKTKEKIKHILAKTFAFTKKLYFPGFKGISLYETFVYLWTGLKKNSIIDRSYSISYKFLIASFPLIIFLFSLIPYIPVAGLQDEILQNILKALPDQLSIY